jgi:hypothetical protein
MKFYKTLLALVLIAAIPAHAEPRAAIGPVVTAANIFSAIGTQLTGDCSLTTGGAITCLDTNGVAFGTFATTNISTGTTALQFLQTNGSGTLSFASSCTYFPLGTAGSVMGTTPETAYTPLTNVGVLAIAAKTAMVMPVGGTFKNLYITVAEGAGASGAFTWSIYINGAASTLTCNVTNNSSSSPVSCSDTTHTPTVTAGQQVALQVVLSGTIANSTYFIGSVEFCNP